MNSEKIFESILNETYVGEIQYPSTAIFKSGKPKKIPLLLKYIYENAGCTKRDVISYLGTQGLGKIPDECWPTLQRDGMVEVVKVGTINKYFPTEKLLSYLKSLNFIENDANLYSSNELKNKTENDYKNLKKDLKIKSYQKELYNNIMYQINWRYTEDYSNRFKNLLTKEQIVEVLNKVIQNYQK